MLYNNIRCFAGIITFNGFGIFFVGGEVFFNFFGRIFLKKKETKKQKNNMPNLFCFRGNDAIRLRLQVLFLLMILTRGTLWCDRNEMP